MTHEVPAKSTAVDLQQTGVPTWILKDWHSKNTWIQSKTSKNIQKHDTQPWTTRGWSWARLHNLWAQKHHDVRPKGSSKNTQVKRSRVSRCSLHPTSITRLLKIWCWFQCLGRQLPMLSAISNFRQQQKESGFNFQCFSCTCIRSRYRRFKGIYFWYA